jgi:hypothetical protein
MIWAGRGKADRREYFPDGLFHLIAALLLSLDRHAG